MYISINFNLGFAKKIISPLKLKSIFLFIWEQKYKFHCFRFPLQERFGDGGEQKRLQRVQFNSAEFLFQFGEHNLHPRPVRFFLLHKRGDRPLWEGAAYDRVGCGTGWFRWNLSCSQQFPLLIWTSRNNTCFSVFLPSLA